MHHHKISVNRDLFLTFLPLLKLWRVTGLCPTTYRKKHNSYVLQWSWKIYSLNSIVAVTLALWGTYGFITDLQLESFVTLGFTGSVDKAISTSDITDILFSSLYFAVSTLPKFKHVQTIMESFDKIDSIIAPQPMTDIQRWSTFFQVLWFAALPSLYTLDVFMWGNTSFQGLSNYLAYYISYSVVIMHELQYWALVRIAHSRLGSINRIIERILSQETSVKRKHVLSIINSYDLAVEAIDSINRCFNISTAVMILSCYIHLVTCPYQLFVMVTSNQTSLLNYVYLLWVSLQVFRLMLIVEVCHRCQQENRVTRSLVSLLVCCKMERDVRNRVEGFFFVVSRRKVRLTAYGLAKISRTMLLSIAGSISGYWMILLQFSWNRARI